MSILDKLREAKIQGRLQESLYYEIVANELEKGQMDKGLHTQAFAEADGNENKAKALYIKLRVESLKDELYIHEKEHKKKKSTEDQNKYKKPENSFRNTASPSENTTFRSEELEDDDPFLTILLVIIMFVIVFAVVIISIS